MPNSPGRYTHLTFANLVGCMVTAILAVHIFVLGHGPAGIDPGLGWHLRTAIWILENRAVPFSPLFAEHHHSTHWVCEQWLSDLILYGLYSLGGLNLMHAFVISCGFLIVFVILQPLSFSQDKAPSASLSLLYFCCFLVLSIQLIIRPVVFGFLCFALLVRLLNSPSFVLSSVRGYIKLCALFILWSNLHPSFSLGLLYLSVFTLSELLSTPNQITHSLRTQFLGFIRCLIPLVLSLVATLVNPNGWLIYQSIFSLLGNEYFMNLNQEWLSPDLLSSSFLVCLGYIVLCLALLIQKSSLPWRDKFLLILFILMGLQSTRYLPFMALATVIPASRVISEKIAKSKESRPIPRDPDSDSQETSVFSRLESKPFFSLRPPVFGLGAFSILLGILIFEGKETQTQFDNASLLPSSAKGLISFLQTLPPHTKLFHSPDLGGIIAWNLWPRLSPFIDDRNQIYPKEAYESYFELARLRSKWQITLEEIKPSVLILNEWEPLRFALSADDWQSRRFGEYIVYERIADTEH